MRSTINQIVMSLNERMKIAKGNTINFDYISLYVIDSSTVRGHDVFLARTEEFEEAFDSRERTTGGNRDDIAFGKSLADGLDGLFARQFLPKWEEGSIYIKHQ
jgi:hypothetical protein